MPTLIERLETDYKIAYKAGERLRVETLRLVKAGIERVAIEKRKQTLDDAEVVQVLTQQAKQRRETLEALKSANRPEAVQQATQELEILAAYLPKQLSDDELRRLVDDAIAEVGQQQGPIMKQVMAKAAGAADGKRVSQLVAERLKPKAA